MKNSEIIRKYSNDIAEAMTERYKTVLECDGRIQYKIFVWEDGEIECLEGPQGDNCYLKAKDTEPRSLCYVGTVSAPFFDPWDASDHAAPDDECEREAERSEIIEYLVDEYRNCVDDVICAAIEENELWEEEC